MRLPSNFTIDYTINASLSFDDGSYLKTEVINVISQGASILVSSTRSIKSLVGKTGRVVFDIAGATLLRTSFSIEKIVEESCMQLCSLKFTELLGDELASRDAGSARRGRPTLQALPGTVSWKTRNGIESRSAYVSVLDSGSVQLNRSGDDPAIPFDVVQCDITVDLPAPLGPISVSSRRQLSDEPCADVFSNQSGAACLATQLISLWAIKATLSTADAVAVLV